MRRSVPVGWGAYRMVSSQTVCFSTTVRGSSAAAQRFQIDGDLGLRTRLQRFGFRQRLLPQFRHEPALRGGIGRREQARLRLVQSDQHALE